MSRFHGPQGLPKKHRGNKGIMRAWREKLWKEAKERNESCVVDHVKPKSASPKQD